MDEHEEPMKIYKKVYKNPLVSDLKLQKYAKEEMKEGIYLD